MPEPGTLRPTKTNPALRQISPAGPSIPMAPAARHRPFWYWLGLPTSDGRDFDLIRMEPSSNSYHMLWFWDLSTTISSFVASKIILSSEEDVGRFRANKGH